MKVFVLVTETSCEDLCGNFETTNNVDVFETKEKACKALKDAENDVKETFSLRYDEESDWFEEVSETSYYINAYDGVYTHIQVIEKEVK